MTNLAIMTDMTYRCVHLIQLFGLARVILTAQLHLIQDNTKILKCLDRMGACAGSTTKKQTSQVVKPITPDIKINKILLEIDQSIIKLKDNIDQVKAILERGQDQSDPEAKNDLNLAQNHNRQILELEAKIKILEELKIKLLVNQLNAQIINVLENANRLIAQNQENLQHRIMYLKDDHLHQGHYQHSLINHFLDMLDGEIQDDCNRLFDQLRKKFAKGKNKNVDQKTMEGNPGKNNIVTMMEELHN